MIVKESKLEAKLVSDFASNVVNGFQCVADHPNGLAQVINKLRQ
jgi:hypothetical protein